VGKFWLGLIVLLAPVLASGQATTDAYLDPGAAALHRAAAANWREIDESIVRYTAKVQQRIAASIRAPLKDRILYRNESAVRVFWDREFDTFIQVLGARAQYPGKEYSEARSFLEDLTIEEAFDPGGDRLIFGFADQEDTAEQQSPEQRSAEFWVAHPLAEGADSLYQYQSGDTLVISIPDRPDLRVIEIQVLPRVADVHRISGSLWIVPETGALVRAVYRLSQQFDAIRDIDELRQEERDGSFKYVPGFLKPWTFDMEMVAIDYSLWNMEVWLPRSMRIEGRAAAGILKFPFSMDLAYSIESVVTESELGTPEYESDVTEERHFKTRAEAMDFISSLMTDADGITYQPLQDDGRGGRGRSSRYLVPEDPAALETSPYLPPPIWEEAVGFASEQQLEEMFARLEALPTPPLGRLPWEANWGWNRPDLIRYNRVEGPAIGGKLGRKFGSPLGPISMEAKGFFGFADLEPKASLSFERQTLRRRWTLGVYRDIRMVDPRGRHLDFGNSLNAFFFGRDDGEYFLASGADLVLTPQETGRQSWEIRAYAERHDAMVTETSFTLAHPFGGDWSFRDNVAARELEEVGGEIRLSPWWGTDPLLPQFGLELYAQGAAWRAIASDDTGNYTRTRAVLRAALPLKEGLWRVGIEAAGGTTWGDAPVQRNWFLGGAQTLRGYRAASAIGTTFGRGRLEVGRVYSAYTWSVFSDAGWAGDRDAFETDDILYSVGIGGSVLDGLVRLDVSRGLRGPFKRTRFDLYLDAIF
jgi:hypothetical protein